MCLPIGCWLCMPRRVDDDLAPARTQTTQRNGGGHYNGNGGHRYNGSGNGNGVHHYNGNGYPAHRAAAEADRKASNDVRTPRGWHGNAATGAQEKQAAYPYAYADGTLKQQPAASNGRVAVAADGHGARGGAPHNYYERAHKEDAAGADSYYPAATATADHESPSPSEALGGQ